MWTPNVDIRSLSETGSLVKPRLAGPSAGVTAHLALQVPEMHTQVLTLAQRHFYIETSPQPRSPNLTKSMPPFSPANYRVINSFFTISVNVPPHF